jgi:glycerol-3-phosphate dehydrogenase
MSIRQKNWQLVENKKFDVVIIGGGICGASIYRNLCAKGYTVLLLDKGDFSCGTSQASAMMIWGGLLYLRNFDFLSIYHFSRDRDDIIRTQQEAVDPKFFRYIVNCEHGRNKYLVQLALYLYWALGNFRRKKPSFQKTFDELRFICQQKAEGSFVYQEGFLKDSDSRFVLNWILSHQNENSCSLNYCNIDEVEYSTTDKLWAINLTDKITNHQCYIKSKIILNCAGAWADTVNQQFGMQTPYRHVFSKGVFIGFKRPGTHQIPLIFEMGEHGDTLTFIPWGPVSLWGPTETLEDSIENGFSVTPEDINFLQQHASRHLDSSLSGSEIISIRCGIRPLAVEKTFKADCYPLDISRFHKVAQDVDSPWLTVYGGKISGCVSMAEEVAQKVAKQIQPSLQGNLKHNNMNNDNNQEPFPGLHEKFPRISWCVENEFCCTLEDYLRRRTNISQWVPREGLGFQNEHKEYIRNLAQELAVIDGKGPDYHFNEYVASVDKRFDQLMKQI